MNLKWSCARLWRHCRKTVRLSSISTEAWWKLKSSLFVRCCQISRPPISRVQTSPTPTLVSMICVTVAISPGQGPAHLMILEVVQTRLWGSLRDSALLVQCSETQIASATLNARSKLIRHLYTKTILLLFVRTSQATQGLTIRKSTALSRVKAVNTRLIWKLPTNTLNALAWTTTTSTKEKIASRRLKTWHPSVTIHTAIRIGTNLPKRKRRLKNKRFSGPIDLSTTRNQ